MAKPKRWTQRTIVLFAKGTFEKIARCLKTGETRADFVRMAVDRELSIRIDENENDVRREERHDR